MSASEWDRITTELEEASEALVQWKAIATKLYEAGKGDLSCDEWNSLFLEFEDLRDAPTASAKDSGAVYWKPRKRGSGK